MSDIKPFTERRGDVLRIVLSNISGKLNATKLVCVVDLTYLGNVVGVEVLDLEKQLSGGTAPVSPPGTEIRWSYDQEVDAFYVHVGEGPGQVQRKATAVAYLSSARQLCELAVHIPWEDA